MIIPKLFQRKADANTVWLKEIISFKQILPAPIDYYTNYPEQC
jgi:hypothetical protein